MQIEIEVYGNPGLYRSSRASFAKESTRHRTWTGAARRLVALHGKAKGWAETTGHWGGWDIRVDGVSLYKKRDEYDCWIAPTPDDARDHYRDPVDYLAEALADRHGDVL